MHLRLQSVKQLETKDISEILMERVYTKNLRGTKKN